MRRFNAEDLYRLLPAVYRARDAETAGQLRALVSVLAEQAGVVEDDITRLYENWFIETCDEWVVPYIGDLLGVGGLHQLPGASAFSQRARVANTLAYRRRKGTATMLEQLARDTTGWNARSVEFFELLSTTQHFNHVRLLNRRTADLRQAGKVELLNTPFDTITHTADVRHIASTRGRHNVPKLGVHLWRLQAYAVVESDARVIGNPADRSFTFDPAGGFWPIGRKRKRRLRSWRRKLMFLSRSAAARSMKNWRSCDKPLWMGGPRHCRFTSAKRRPFASGVKPCPTGPSRKLLRIRSASPT
jgi:hypothetical protein